MRRRGDGSCSGGGGRGADKGATRPLDFSIAVANTLIRLPISNCFLCLFVCERIFTIVVKTQHRPSKREGRENYKHFRIIFAAAVLHHETPSRPRLRTHTHTSPEGGREKSVARSSKGCCCSSIAATGLPVVVWRRGRRMNWRRGG